MTPRLRSWVGVTLAAVALLVAADVAAQPVARITSVQSTSTGVLVNVSVLGTSEAWNTVPKVSATIAGTDVPATVQLRSSMAETGAEPRSIVFLVDTSGSMANGSLYDAKLATLEFLRELPDGDRVGVVAFGDTVEVVAPMTSDRNAVAAAIPKLRPRGDTALYDGVNVALAQLGDAGRRMLILLSDGQDTSSSATLAGVVAAARNSGVQVNAIQVGDSQRPIAALQEIAAAGMGQLYASADAGDLVRVFRTTTELATTKLAIFISVTPDTPRGTQSIAITLDSGAEQVFVSGPVELPKVTAAPDRGNAEPLLIGLSVLLAGSLFTLLLMLSAGSARARKRRIEQVLAIRNQMLGIEGDAQSGDATLIESIEELLRPWVRRAGVEDRWTLLLDGAGIPITVEQWLLARIMSVIVPMLLFIGLFPNSLALALTAGIAGLFLPNAFLKWRRASRSRTFEAGLPDLLMLVASSLRTGFSLEQAIVTAAEQSDGAAAHQMRRAIQEIRIGLPLEVALDRVAERMASKDFAWVVTALRIQRKSGGNLSELLTTAARTVRERAEIRREVLTLTAEGRLSANVMIVMPIGMFFYLLATQPDYIEPLWTTPVGRMLSALGVMLLVLGWFVMQRLVKVDT